MRVVGEDANRQPWMVFRSLADAVDDAGGFGLLFAFPYFAQGRDWPVFQMIPGTRLQVSRRAVTPVFTEAHVRDSAL